MSLLKQKSKIALTAVTLIAGFFLAGSVLAQDFIASDTTALPGGQATVDLSWVSNGDVANMVVKIEFDDTKLTPVQTTPPDVDGCLDDLAPPHSGNMFTTCTVIGAGLISVTLNDPSAELTTQNIGSITFDVDAGVVAADTFTIDVEVMSAGNTGGAAYDHTLLNGVNGTITIAAGPQSELSAAPAAIAFGVNDLSAFPLSDTVTFTNTGDPGSSLDIAGVALDAAGDAEYSIDADTCTGATLNDGDSCVVTIGFNAVANGVYNTALEVSSNADVTPNHNIAVSGEADSAPMLSGAIMGGNNLGAGQPGDTLSTVVNFTNTGSAADDVTCNIINDAAGAFGFNPAAPFPLAIGPNGGDGSFDLTCTLPAAANPGDIFTADLVCGGAVFGDVLDVEVSCRVAPARAAVPVPTMQKWSLVLLSLLMLVVGGLSVRFFRA